MLSKEGIEMMDVKSIQREGERLVLKGKIMGSMPATIYLRPEDVWAGWQLLPFSVLAVLPVMLFKGFRRSRKSAAAQTPAAH